MKMMTAQVLIFGGWAVLPGWCFRMVLFLMASNIFPGYDLSIPFQIGTQVLLLAVAEHGN